MTDVYNQLKKLAGERGTGFDDEELRKVAEEIHAEAQERIKRDDDEMKGLINEMAKEMPAAVVQLASLSCKLTKAMEEGFEGGPDGLYRMVLVAVGKSGRPGAEEGEIVICVESAGIDPDDEHESTQAVLEAAAESMKSKPRGGSAPDPGMPESF